jgi:hypothetical protein
LTQDKGAMPHRIAQDWGNRSKTAKVIFKFRPHFQNPWDYLRAPIAPAPSNETDRVDMTHSVRP